MFYQESLKIICSLSNQYFENEGLNKKLWEYLTTGTFPTIYPWKSVRNLTIQEGPLTRCIFKADIFSKNACFIFGLFEPPYIQGMHFIFSVCFECCLFKAAIIKARHLFQDLLHINRLEYYKHDDIYNVFHMCNILINLCKHLISMQHLGRRHWHERHDGYVAFPVYSLPKC